MGMHRTAQYLRALALGICVATSLGCSDNVDGDATANGGAGGRATASPTDIREMQITVGDLVFDARVAGPDDGDLVLLLHGFPQTSYEWRHQLEALAEAGYRAVAPNQRGYSPGARPDAVEDYSIVLLVQDVLGMVDALGADRFHLVGHDWGASVVWVTAAFAPERIASLTPISVPHVDAFAQTRADPESCQFSASGYINSFVMPGFEKTLLENDAAILRGIYTGIPEDDIQVYLDELGNEEALRAGLNWYRANLAGNSANPAIGATTVPTLYIWSDQDIALCIDGALLTEQFVTGPYQFEILEGISHWVPDSAPEQVNALLLAHIEKFPIQ